MKPIIETRSLKKYFKTAGGMLHAVDDVSFTIEEGEILGVVGESGCGKSTLGRTVIHLTEATDGQILFDGKDITWVKKSDLKALRKQMQIVFQDPYASLDPRKTVRDIVAEPLNIYKVFSSHAERDDYIDDLMNVVGLTSRMIGSYPHELDGGRRQRVGIARALALNPRFIVCDEPVSALDVSIQAQILNLMQDLQEERNLTYMFITHDLSVVKHIATRIMVMYLGQVVEYATSDELFSNPMHPYTKALLSAVPVARLTGKRERIILQGEITSPVDPKPGCRFSSRCWMCKDECTQDNIPLRELSPGHFVSCVQAQ